MGPKNGEIWQNANFVKTAKLYISSCCFEPFCNGPQENHLYAYTEQHINKKKGKINWMEKLKYEGQGHSYKFSIFKNVKNRDF